MLVTGWAAARAFEKAPVMENVLLETARVLEKALEWVAEMVTVLSSPLETGMLATEKAVVLATQKASALPQWAS
jgi:hypothetical protein